MRILITGAAGQLGHDLQSALATDELVPLDHRGLDITDRDAVLTVLTRIRPAWVINAAAFNDVDAAETLRDRAFAVNAAGPGNLAEAATRIGARMVHISSDYVFNGRKGSAYDENDPPDPLSVYGRSKYDGERRVLEAAPSACVIRTAWLYGRHGRNFVSAILAAADAGGPIKVVADQVGSPTSTVDLAAGIRQLLRADARGLFHVVNTGATSRFDFARAIVSDRAAVLPITSGEAARPAPRPANSSLTSVRWEAAGLQPLPPWRAALADFLAARSATGRPAAPTDA